MNMHKGKNPMFSILMVSLNPGEKLLETLQSVEKQSFVDYEVVIKDGGSKDTSLTDVKAYLQEKQEFASRVRIIEERDKSIYDGMNQAVKYGKGDYFYFLNCGDLFVDEKVLEQTAFEINKAKEEGSQALIFYGNIFDNLRSQIVPSNTKIDDFACYRNVPCHQACIYHRSLFAERGYDLAYRVRADYEHFLWSYFKGNAKPKYISVTLASYEGGGFSETKENRKKSAKEHKEIVGLYMSPFKVWWYGAIMMLTLAPLRTKLAESTVTAGFYNAIKKMVYGRNK